jgi:hypothetical protein
MGITKFLFSILSILVLLLAILLGIITFTEKTFYKKPSLLEVNKETEIQTKINIISEKPIEVLNRKGSLSLIGWTNTDKNFIFDSKLINPSTSIIPNALSSLRFKKWDAYAFSSPKYVGTFAVFDLGYIGGIMFHMGEIKLDGSVAQTVLFEYLNPTFHPSIVDQCFNSNTKDKGFCKNGVSEELYLKHFDSNNSDLKKIHLWISPKKNHFIEFSINKLLSDGSNFSMKIDLKLQGKDLDSMVTLTPIIEDKSLFYYNVKSYNLKPAGDIQINGRNEIPGEFLFAYDAGRGAWPIKSGWVWIYGQGKTSGNNVFGFNFGHGFTHPSAKFTEDSFFIDGKMHKIHNLQYFIEDVKNKYGYNDYVFSNKNEKNYEQKSICELRFTTTGVNGKSINLLVADIVFNIKYGVYSGSCFDDSGNKYDLVNVIGIIEEKMSIW